jgi:hypothetical protein
MVKGSGSCWLKVGDTHETSSLKVKAKCVDRHSADYYGKPGLIQDEPMWLEKGERRAVRHDYQEYNGDSTFRAAVRIHADDGPDPPFVKTQEEEQYHSWNEVQKVTFNANYNREIDEFTIKNVKSGSFQIKKEITECVRGRSCHVVVWLLLPRG